MPGCQRWVQTRVELHPSDDRCQHRPVGRKEETALSACVCVCGGGGGRLGGLFLVSVGAVLPRVCLAVGVRVSAPLFFFFFVFFLPLVFSSERERE